MRTHDRTTRWAVRSIIIIITVLLSLTSPFVQGQTYAACVNNQNNIIPRPEGLPTLGCDAGTSATKIQLIMKIVFGTLALFSLLFIVIGGMKYTLSGGDSNAIASAKKTILYAVIGLVLGLMVFVISGFIFGALE